MKPFTEAPKGSVMDTMSLGGLNKAKAMEYCLGMQSHSAVSGLENPTSGEHMLGTSIMAVEFKGGVVLGADSRTSTGSYVANRVSDKLTRVSDHIYCCRSGSAADTQAISDIVDYYLNLHTLELNKTPLVKTAATVFRDLCYSNKDKLMAGIIVGGYDEKEGGAVYNIPLGGALVRQPYAIGGSGSTYIYGYCDAHFKEGMTQEECRKFVIQALAQAMNRDGSSGGIIRLAIITKDGVKREFIPGDKLPYTGVQV